MYRNLNVQIEVGGIELAERAGQIAREKGITFGEALFQARRDMANGIDTVQRNTGSPLRDQEQSTTPTSGAVHEAVMMGLMVSAPTWKPAGDEGSWRASTGASVLRAACDDVGNKLDQLGLGDQVISAIKADLYGFLTNQMLKQPYTGKLSDLLALAADRVVQVYEQALKNKVATQQWGEAAEVVLNGRPVFIDTSSVNRAERAQQIVTRTGVSFGEALRMVNREVTFADDVIDAQTLSNALTGSLKSAFASIFGGSAQKIIDAMDVLKIKEQADKSLRDLGIGNGLAAVTKAVEVALNNATGVVQLTAVDGLISKVVSAAQKAYTQAISNI